MAKFVGSRSRSKEGPRHVTGRGLYTDDFMLPGMLQAMILRSPHAHAKIVSIDPSEALKNPNVITVITPDDVKQSTRPFRPGRYAAGLKRPIDEYAGAVDKVRYVGEPVGAVAARNRGTAEDALELISVEYEPLRSVVDVREAIKPSSAVVFDEVGSNLAWDGALKHGEIDGAFKSADRIVKENLKIHRYSSTPLEPFAVIASYDAASKRLTVWVTAQVPEVIYDGLREALGLQDVRVIIPDVGGGFGQKIHLIRKYVVLISLLAMKSGRPVKWIEDRSEHMMAGGHACAQEFEAEAAVKNDGTVLGLRFKEYDDVGGSISTLTIHFTNKLNNLSNTYRTPNISMEGFAVVTNKCPVIPNRGIGKPGMCFVWERMMDRVAQELNLSPIEVRRKNLIQPNEMPYSTVSGNVYDSGDYPGLLQGLLEKIDYDKLREEQKREREKGRLNDIGAVHGAATRLREKILKLSAHVLNVDSKELAIEDSTVKVPGSTVKQVSFAELGRIAYNNQHLIPDDMEPGLQATYYYTFPHAKPNIVPNAERLVRAQFTFSAGAHAAVVEIDKATGKVEVLRYLILGDNGTVINPDVVNGQVYGSATHGIAVALGEGFIYSPDGQPLTVTYLDYGKCSTVETPKIEVVHRPSPSPFTTLGQKAAGEGAAIPSPAAIASAVEDALTPLGVKITDLPLTPEVVWRLVNNNPESSRRSY